MHTSDGFALPLTRRGAAPLGESGGAGQLEEGSAGEAAVGVDVDGDGGVDGRKLLQTSHAQEPPNGPLRSTERLALRRTARAHLRPRPHHSVVAHHTSADVERWPWLASNFRQPKERLINRFGFAGIAA